MFTESQYTKGDLFDYFNVRNNKEIIPGQICGTVIFIKKCKKSIEIMEKYLKVFYDDFSLVDDSSSKSNNFIEFIFHRHDQSVWSILAKLNDVPCISHSEQWASNWETLKEYPILAKRDKEYSWNKYFLNKIKNKLRKLFYKKKKNGT